MDIITIPFLKIGKLRNREVEGSALQSVHSTAFEPRQFKEPVALGQLGGSVS